MIAQTYAAVNGYQSLDHSENPSKGYLVGLRQFISHGKAKAEQVIKIHIKQTHSFEKFHIIQGILTCEDRLILEGELKVWLMSKDQTK